MAYFIDDMRRFVSFVNWHLWFRLEHSEHAVVSVASHCTLVSDFSRLLTALRQRRTILNHVWNFREDERPLRCTVAVRILLDS